LAKGKSGIKLASTGDNRD